MGLPRRKTDDEGVDNRSLRGGLQNGHTRWIVRVVSTALVAGLGYYIIHDHERIDKDRDLQNRRLLVLETSVTSLVAAQAAAQGRGEAQWAEVLRRLGSIETDLKAVKQEVRQ